MVGSQYGHRPIPRLISETEFELLLLKLSHDQEGLTVLKKWFIKDDNSVPPKYVLQPITTHYPYYNDTKPEARPQHDADILSWNLTEARLLQLLCSAALQAEKDGDLSAEQKHNFFMSREKMFCQFVKVQLILMIITIHLVILLCFMSHSDGKGDGAEFSVFKRPEEDNVCHLCQGSTSFEEK